MSDFSLDRLAAFPKSRHGYARGPVDDYVAGVQRAVESLRADNESLGDQLRRLSEQLTETDHKYERIRTARIDERAQDILAEAESRAAGIVAQGERAAAEIVRLAQGEAEVAMERSRQELAWARRQLAAERTEFDRQQQASLPAAPAEPVDRGQTVDEGPAAAGFGTPEHGPDVGQSG